MTKIESFSTLCLKDMLNQKELNDVIKYPLFKTDIKKGYIYEKDELILKLITLAIEKFKQSNEYGIVKCLNWVKKQLQIHLEIKPDTYTYSNLEKMKQSKPNLKMRISWMEEYSLLSKEETIIKLAKKTEKNLQPKQNETKKIIAARRSTLNPELLKSGIMNRINENLLDFESPKFDIFKLEEKVGKENILPVTSTFVFASLGLFILFDYKKFEPFIFRVASKYNRENPYHTDLHAADMVQTLLLYFLYGNMQKSLELTDLDIASIFLAAAIHDLNHPGFTNNFLINTKNELAIRYNDQSVLENFHVSEGFNIILNKPNCNIFNLLSDDDYKLCRKRIIDCVLATDMAFHNKEFQFLKMRLQSFGIKNGENIEKLFDGLDIVTSYNLKQDFLNCLIHAADTSNPTKPIEIYKQWARRCVDEFFKQGDVEKKLGLKVSFNCDRETAQISQIQVGFIDAIVFPLFNVVVEFFPDLKFTIDNLKVNLAYFKGIKERNELKGKEEIIKEEEKEDVSITISESDESSKTISNK